MPLIMVAWSGGRVASRATISTTIISLLLTTLMLPHVSFTALPQKSAGLLVKAFQLPVPPSSSLSVSLRTRTANRGRQTPKNHRRVFRTKIPPTLPFALRYFHSSISGSYDFGKLLLSSMVTPSSADPLTDTPSVPTGGGTESIATNEADENEEGRSSSSLLSTFDKFDYLSCWYPISWAEDLPLNKPTKITLFDTDYVVARVAAKHGIKNNNKKKKKKKKGNYEDEEVVALVDRCPHKSAALSEGRITSCGNFQCAYHGWTFDGKNGTCVEIPQILSANNGEISSPLSSSSSSSSSVRTSATAIPAMISQGMVWLFPGGDLEKALLAPPPPTIPEIDMEGFKVSHIIRDFPVDWPILLENIMDPDHGLFAHGMTGFDLYAATTDLPQKTEERETNNGKGWTITSKVEAVEKMAKLNRLRQRGEGGEKPKRDKKKKNETDVVASAKIATTTFHAPSVVWSCRRDRVTNETTFITAFWICPVGTGRSRFMAAAIGKIPFIPRWLHHINLNAFVDQDTFLLATQQPHVLAAEAEAVRDMPDDADLTKMKLNARKKLFVYRSPTERLGVRIGAFFDATLARCPNRLSAIRTMLSDTIPPTPDREVVLDRYKQHTSICSDSRDFVRNCDNIVKISKVGMILVGLVKALAFGYASSSPSSSSLGVGSTVARGVNAALRPGLLAGTLIVATAASWIANKLRKEFFFKYTEKFRDEDLAKIPNVWKDTEKE